MTDLNKDAYKKAWEAYLNTPIDMVADTDDETRKCVEAAIRAYLAALPAEGLAAREWRCFHCDEVFDNADDALAHFGNSELDEPGCKLNATEGGLLGLYREAELELRRYRQEDHEASRTFYSLGADHASALQREEEKGYERGLRDGRGLREAAATISAPGGWQPIETAPKDGTWVLFYVPTKHIPTSKNFVLTMGPRFLAGHWVNGPPEMRGYTPSKHVEKLCVAHGGYWSATPRGKKPLHGQPTHWMPQPAAPHQEKAG